jgi:P4 family phage/plasmid primase-like protien
MTDNSKTGSPENRGNTPEAFAQPPNNKPNDELAIPAPAHPENPVDELRGLLGHDVVLLPIAAGEKAPRFAGWNETTIERMEDPEYRARFAGGNVGVLLGKSSGNLCTIDVDSDDDFAAFLRLNPRLEGTLQTKGARGGNIWFRLSGDYPALTKIKRADGSDWGEFRATGGQTIIHGVHPNGMNYQRLVDAPPIEISFTEIVWPETLVLPWAKNDYDALVEEEGEPFQYDKSGRVTLNEPSIVAKFVRERLSLYEPDETAFYQYDSTSGLWVHRKEEVIKNQFCRDLKSASDDLGDRRVLAVRTNGRVTSMAALLKGQVGRKEAFAGKRPFIQCQNGVLYLESDPPELRTFSPDYYSRNSSPIAYDPAATCPRFLNELLGQALGEDDISLIQRIGGAMLMGRNAAQKLLLLTGTAGGGKSTLVTIIERIIGLENVAELRTDHLGERFEMHAYVGKTLLTGKDVTADFLQQKGASKIKSLVGGDLLQCEKKGGAHFQIRGEYNMIITCNSSLRIRLEGDNEAWERRILSINYERPKPKQRVVDFADKLIADEGSGILNFFIEGALQHLEELKVRGDYRLSHLQDNRIAAILRESDSIRQFVESRVIAFPEGDITSAEISAAYYRFCERQGWHAYPAHEVNKKLPDLMLEIHHVNPSHDIRRDDSARRGYRRVVLRPENE